ncbi:MAG: glycosyltransferase family 2 protein [Planctomycetes bacterium]|nr:glycosyltransferase family 2 protein [Planctomycetota bacterium]
MEVSVVVPVYNEEENVLPLCASIKAVLEKEVAGPHELIFVDDGSSDGTFDRLQEIHESYEHVAVIRFRRNFGQSAAMSAGFDYARGKVIIPMDGDCQNDPADIPRLLAKLDEGYDIVSGWRKERKDGLLSRRFPSVIANWLIGRVGGIRLHDYGCTLKAYRADVIKTVNLYGEMHRFIPLLAKWAGAKITEIPVKHHPRRAGRTKYGLSRTVRVVLDLVTVSFLLRFMTRPLQIFGLFGLGALFAGFVSGAATVFLKVVSGVDMTGNPLLLLTVLLFMGSIQFVCIGLLGEIGVRTYYESQSKRPYFIRTILGPGGKDVGRNKG